MKISTLAISLVLVFIPALLGADGGFKCSCGDVGPKIDDVLLAKGYAADGKPIEPTTTFRPDDTFYCIAKVHLGGAKQVVVGIEWSQADTKIDSATVTLEQSRDAVMFVKPEKPWPRGDYKAVVLLDGSAKQELVFRVE